MMKKIGVGGLLLVGFVAGVTFVYSCGGSSTASAAEDMTAVVGKLEEVRIGVGELKKTLSPAESAKTITLLDHAVFEPTAETLQTPTLDTRGYSKARVWILCDGIYVNGTLAEISINGILTNYSRSFAQMTPTSPSRTALDGDSVGELPFLGDSITFRLTKGSTGDTGIVSVVVQLYV